MTSNVMTCPSRRLSNLVLGLLSSLALFEGTTQAALLPVQITIENLAPENGTFLTPLWFGFHDGTFDLYDRGAPASRALERLAEDGDTGPLGMAFLTSGAGSVESTLAGIGPIGPGQATSTVVMLDTDSMTSRYFSYASMVIPSNDFFIANGDPLAFRIVDAMGNFLGADFVVAGSQILDAGTEVNDENPMNTAFFGQSMPDAGVTENGIVDLATGFLPNGPILSTPMFANADFTLPGYRVARITVRAVPEPSACLLLPAGGLIILAANRVRRLRPTRQD